MCRGGSTGPRGRARAFRALAVRLTAVAVALAMAVGGAFPERAHAGGSEPGFVMVICSDGVAKTVVIDSEGNPVEPSDPDACIDLCVACTAPDNDAAGSAPGGSVAWDAVRTMAVFEMTPANLPAERRSGTGARAPPFKKDA